MTVNDIYYFFRPVIPRPVQLWVRRQQVARKRARVASSWPIDKAAGEPPSGWFGWPDKKRFALVLTHDVESAKGCKTCLPLMQLEKKLGFRSSFNFVPERYPIPAGLREQLCAEGFEIGVHGLKHDGKLYLSREVFLERAQKINAYLRDWGAVGFRSPAMHHNLDWLADLDISYDASTFDTDPFEPQSDGVGTIFPFLYGGKSSQRSYVELPYTLPQDFTLFVLMQEKTIDIWKQKLDWIVERGGMALLNTHPDYMQFSADSPGPEEFPVSYYAEFLAYIQQTYAGQYWSALPQDIPPFLLKQELSDRDKGAGAELAAVPVKQSVEMKGALG